MPELTERQEALTTAGPVRAGLLRWRLGVAGKRERHLFPTLALGFFSILVLLACISLPV